MKETNEELLKKEPDKSEEEEIKDETEDFFSPKAKYQRLMKEYNEAVSKLDKKIGFWRTFGLTIIATIVIVAVGCCIYTNSLYHKFEDIYNTNAIESADDAFHAFKKWMAHKEYKNLQIDESGNLVVINPKLYEISKPRIIYDEVISPGYYIVAGGLYDDTIMTITSTEDPNVYTVVFDIYFTNNARTEDPKITFTYQILMSENRTSGMSLDGDLLIHVKDTSYVVTLINKPDSQMSWLNFEGKYKKLMNFSEGEA